MKLIASIILIVSNFFVYQNISANIDSKIIVKVENEIITNYELKNKILTSLILSGQEINQQNIDNLKKGVLTQLIEIKLKKIEILKYKIQKDEIRINSYLSSISNNNLQNFKNKFFENNINFEIFLDEIDTEFRWQKLIYGLYSKKINIDEEKVNDEIEKIIKQDASIDEFELSEIEINLSPGENSEKTIKEIYEKINTIGFDNVAMNFSTSSTSSQKGYLGWISSKALSKEIFKEVSKINLGEVSRPIRKQNNVLILKLINKRKIKSGELDLKKLKNDIITKKRTDLFNLYSQSRLSKLKNNSYIKY